MSSLLKIRSERDRMSAIERRIADFILDNAQLLRDYSSQQLANALGISQSSVVKFSQKLGFKGYPDLKYSIGESIARNGDENGGASHGATDDAHASPAAELWLAKSRAGDETRLINPEERLDAIALRLRTADKVFLVGIGSDSIAARGFAIRLSLLGILAIHHFDPVLVPAEVSTSSPSDVLLLFSEHGQQASFCQLARLFRARGGHVVSVTRHNANPLRAHADSQLLVSAHDDRAHIVPLLYQSALQHLLDQIFLLVCEDEDRRRQLDDNHMQVLHLLDT
ncbi:MAG: MurR/RpiR family transcriptional regulator [Luteimonas sp.]|nr:MurR/RpiR family transcriptional regulator [Luteimonas sp.]